MESVAGLMDCHCRPGSAALFVGPLESPRPARCNYPSSYRKENRGPGFFAKHNLQHCSSGLRFVTPYEQKLSGFEVRRSFGCRPRSKWSGRCVVSATAAGKDTVKVVLVGIGTPLGREAIRAISQARGLQLAGAVDTAHVGRDAGELAGLDEPLEVPVLDDIVMVLGSISQGQGNGVMVELTGSHTAYENVRQATAFGLKSVVVGDALDDEQLATLLEFCDKASTGCVVAPTLSIGAALLQQAAAVAAFHYGRIELVESLPPSSARNDGPSVFALQVANALSGTGRIYNMEENGSSSTSSARGAEAGDGVRIHSLRQPGLLSSLDVRFGAPGEALSLRHDVSSEAAYMPGLLLAIRRVMRLKSLVCGIEKLL